MSTTFATGVSATCETNWYASSIESPVSALTQPTSSLWAIRKASSSGLVEPVVIRQGHCVVGFPLVTAVTRSGDRRRTQAMLVLPQFEVEPRIRNPQTRTIYPRNGMTRSHQPRPDRRPTDRTLSVHIDKSQTSPAITGLIRPQSPWTPDEPDT